MQNYKDIQNKVHVLDSIEYEYLLPVDCIAITQEEADALNAPIPLTVEQKRALLQPLSAWQVRKVLTNLGLRDSVEAAVANADAETKDAWQYASSFQRDDAMLNDMAVSLGLTDVQLDSMFELGVTL